MAVLRTAASGLIILGMCYLVASGYAGVHGESVQRLVIPFPHQILDALWQERETLLDSSTQTAFSALVGFIAAVAVGYELSLLLAAANWIKRSLYFWVLVLQMTTVVILAPIFVLWMGEG